jgi:hypothetical protein
MHFTRICAAVPQENRAGENVVYDPDHGVQKAVILLIEQQKASYYIPLTNSSRKGY